MNGMTTATDRVAVITGANAGLGFQTALKLARDGTHVVMACRNAERAAKARSALLAEAPQARATVMPLELSEPRSIQDFVRQFSQQLGQLDLLINNAGVAAIPLGRNSIGQELQLATNYLGAFALTGLLLPLFRKDAPARIVNVGSLAHRMGKLELDDLNWDKTPYSEWKGYAQSKLAVLSFTMELDRRLRKGDGRIAALAAHPGFAATEISKSSPALTPKSAFGKWFNKKMEALIPTAAEAAAPILHAATSAEAKGGEYYGPRGFLEIGGKTGKARLNPLARNEAIGKRLWALSESMTGVRYLSEF